MDGPANLDHLPDNPALLKGIVRELLVTHHAQQRQIDQLTHRLDLLLKQVYGPRADKLDPHQLSLFADLPEACDNTLALARRCAVMAESRKPLLPVCPKVRPGQTEEETVRAMALEGLAATVRERLQGFPDGWTEDQADSHRYKQLGNAVAVPVIEWIARRLIEVA